MHTSENIFDFNFQVFTEDNKKVYQTYGTGPVTIQLGTGMIMPGLDKVSILNILPYFLY